MSRHDWAADGLDMDGRRLHRCLRCGCLSSWPMARASCPFGLLTHEEYQAHRAEVRKRSRERMAAGLPPHADNSRKVPGPGRPRIAPLDDDHRVRLEKARAYKRAWRSKRVQAIGLTAARAAEAAAVKRWREKRKEAAE